MSEYFKGVNGERVPMTPEEIAARQAEEAEQAALAALPKVPEIVSMRQARLALLHAGQLAQVQSALAALTGVEGDAARIEWEYATEVRRDAALVASLGAALALDDAALDALFVQASAL